MSQDLRIRPSELYGISNDFVAYCFDRAVRHFGKSVESDLAMATSNAKNQSEAQMKHNQVLKQWDLLGDSQSSGQKFRDPAGSGQMVL